MDFLKNIFGTGANIFGAGTSMDMDKYKKAGLLEKADFDKAQDQSLIRGLLGAGIGYLAQPQNKNYGSITPYLAKGFQQGMEQAQKPFDKLSTKASQNNKLDDIIAKKEETKNLNTSIDDFITANPDYEAIRGLPVKFQGEILADHYKPQTAKDPSLRDKYAEQLTRKYIAEGDDPVTASNKAMAEALNIGQQSVKINTALTPEAILAKGKMEGNKAIINGLGAEYNSLSGLENTITAIQKARRLNKKGDASMYQGSFADTKLAVAKFASENLGITINPQGISDAQELTSVLFTNVLDNLKKMDASPSEAQQRMLAKAMGTTESTPEALEMILKFWEGNMISKIGNYNKKVNSLTDEQKEMLGHQRTIRVPSYTGNANGRQFTIYTNGQGFYRDGSPLPEALQQEILSKRKR
jgi:hypothetical protein